MSALLLADVDAMLADLEAEFESQTLVAGFNDPSPDTNTCPCSTGTCPCSDED